MSVLNFWCGHWEFRNSGRGQTRWRNHPWSSIRASAAAVPLVLCSSAEPDLWPPCGYTVLPSHGVGIRTASSWKMPSHDSGSRAELHIFLAAGERRWRPWGSYEELQPLLLIITTIVATLHKLWATSNYLLTTHSQILTAQRANSGPASTTQTQNTIPFHADKQRRVH